MGLNMQVHLAILTLVRHLADVKIAYGFLNLAFYECTIACRFTNVRCYDEFYLQYHHSMDLFPFELTRNNLNFHFTYLIYLSLFLIRCARRKFCPGNFRIINATIYIIKYRYSIYYMHIYLLIYNSQ